MEKLGFCSNWITWIRACISSTSFSILLNGSPFGFFSPERGLRQGDPLSPFLFIIGSEVFSRLMYREECAGAIRGLKISKNNAAIHHLLFADDLLIFGRANLAEATSIKSCLEKYCRWSGQKINSFKSSIRFSKNTNPSLISSISAILPYTSNPTKSLYLGLPILMGNSKRDAFNFILDKVLSKMEGWRAKTLSQAGRLVLIKSIAATIPSYAMSTFLLPSSFCSQLDRSFKNFWWGFPPAKSRNLTLKAWDTLCIPKDLGGLGIRKMREVNLALVSKLGWNLLCKADSMWVAQLRGKYLHSNSFLTPSTLSSSSWLWKGITNSISVISKGACLKIHRQSSLPIWSSPWIPTLNSYIPIPSPHLNQPLPNLLITDLFSHTLNSTETYWNIPLINYLFDSSSAREIQKIRISNSPSEEFIWTPSPSGLFTSKSAYNLITTPRISIASSPLTPTQWKALWKLKLMDRLKLFLWKVAWDIVPSKTRINAVFPIPQADLICPLCKVEEDSLHHLFFRCFFARISWRSSHWPLDSLKWSTLTLPNWIIGILSPNKYFGIPLVDTHLFQIFATVLCDSLWFARNQAIHNGVFPKASNFADKIMRLSLEHYAAWNTTSQPMKESWNPPQQGSYKVNFDIATADHFSVQVAVCRDANGQIIKTLYQFSPTYEHAYREAQAALLAAKLATSLKIESFVLEGISDIVISSLQQPSTVLDWQIASLISDVISLIPSSSHWEARKVNRSANFCAHYVAYWAAARVFSGCIPTFFSPFSPPISIPICSGKDPPPTLPSL
ncbi:uncharacterized protein LOC132181985 [Corylus avellana]|uniref:uncharacterized protein LOC132181985 n=1 Tax=Corylus avellana TaxID=13451 RepID=UPI00286C890B|nr:uncharacterized protein LOC132181985 [Corylus avellana]